MAYYYVKAGFGTATGDGGRYASQQTGTITSLGASGVYNNIALAIAATTPPALGDLINPSDLHDFNAGSAINIQTLATIVSVDDSNVNQGRTTGNFAKEETSSAGDINLDGNIISGVHFTVGDDMACLGHVKVMDSKFEATGDGDNAIALLVDGNSATLINTELVFRFVRSRVTVSNGCTLRASGGSVSSGVALDFLTNTGFVNGGGSLHFKGVDLTSITGTLIANVGGDEAGDDMIDVSFDMCKLGAGVTRTNETFKSYNQRVLLTRCSDSSAAAEYQYGLTAFGGDVDDDSAIFRNESPAFTDSGQKISYKIVTNSDASLGFPLWFDMPLNKWSVLSSASTDTLRFYITSNTALTDKDIYIEISYPDGTNKQTPNFLTSAPATVGGTLDLMATGTTLTTDAVSSWTGALSNLYQIDLDTSVDVGSDTYPIIKVYTTIPSVTINIAMDFTPL